MTKWVYSVMQKLNKVININSSYIINDNIKCYDNNRYWKWLISSIVITNKISSEMEIISYNKLILLKIHILC